LVFKLFGWNNKGGPLGNGVKEFVFNQGRFYRETLQVRIGTYVGFLRLMSDLKRKVRGSDYTRAIKNSGTNPQAKNIEIIQSQEQSVHQNKFCPSIFY
jgi:hypothetical protein